MNGFELFGLITAGIVVCGVALDWMRHRADRADADAERWERHQALLREIRRHDERTHR